MAKRKSKEAVVESEAVSTLVDVSNLKVDLHMEIDQSFGGHKLKVTITLLNDGTKISESSDWVTIPH